MQNYVTRINRENTCLSKENLCRILSSGAILVSYSPNRLSINLFALSFCLYSFKSVFLRCRKTKHNKTIKIHTEFSYITWVHKWIHLSWRNDISYFVDRLGSGHSREPNIMFSFPAEDVELFPVYLYFEWVILDLCCGFGLANFVRYILFLLRFTHILAKDIRKISGLDNGIWTTVRFSEIGLWQAEYRYSERHWDTSV